MTVNAMVACSIPTTGNYIFDTILPRNASKFGGKWGTKHSFTLYLAVFEKIVGPIWDELFSFLRSVFRIMPRMQAEYKERSVLTLSYFCICCYAE